MSEQRGGLGEKSFTTGHSIPHISLDHVDYFLPPSKSHMIRMLAIASIHDGTTNLLVRGKLGLDIESMISCLITLGVGIERVSNDDGLVITVDGVGKNGFTKPNSEVNCGNSGTALRIILGLVASLNEQVTVSGDDSLSIRDNNSMLESLSTFPMGFRHAVEHTKTQDQQTSWQHFGEAGRQVYDSQLKPKPLIGSVPMPTQ